MRIGDLEHKCEEIYLSKQQLGSKRIELQKLNIEITKQTQEALILEEIAKLRGQKYEGGPNLEELKKANQEVEALQDKNKRLEKEIYEGLKDINFDIPMEVPRVDSNGVSIITFEGGPYSYLVKFIASELSSDVPAKIDNVELHPDKIVITNVKRPIHVIEGLKVLHSNIHRLATIALKEEVRDVEEIAEYLHESAYHEIWEAIKGRKEITNKDLYSELHLETPEERKKVRNFFTVLETMLKDKEKLIFIRTSPGTYELTFLGSLVWKSYHDKYRGESEVMKEASPEVTAEKPINKEEKSKTSTLNKYLTIEDKKIIYGKKVE